jgi:hypothetical protein
MNSNRRRKRHICNRQRARRTERSLEARLAALEREVLEGSRTAESLVTIPRDMVVAAVVTFPRDAFGKPEDW